MYFYKPNGLVFFSISEDSTGNALSLYDNHIYIACNMKTERTRTYLLCYGRVFKLTIRFFFELAHCITVIDAPSNTFLLSFSLLHPYLHLLLPNNSSSLSPHSPSTVLIIDTPPPPSSILPFLSPSHLSPFSHHPPSYLLLHIAFFN